MNGDFLRPTSVLFVIFITDEDDRSVALSRRSQNDPLTMDCPAPDRNAPAACFNPDCRCLARSVVCNQPLNTEGTKTNCVERDNSFLERVDSYANFFRTLRPDGRLLLRGIWTLPSLDGDGRLAVVRTGGTRSDHLNRAGGANAGCMYMNDASVLGRPQIRLSKPVRQFPNSLEASVCDVDDYPKALDSIAVAVRRTLAVECLAGVPRTAGGRPICLLGDVDARTPRGAPDVPFPP